LAREVKENHASFIEGMNQISDIAMDVTRAKIHVGNSLQKLKMSKECLVRGTLGITYQRRRFERLVDLRARLDWLRSLVEVEGEVMRACAEVRFTDALKAVRLASQRLQEPQANSYAQVTFLKSRCASARTLLADKLQSSLEAQLVQFDPRVYRAIMGAYHEMDASAAAAAAAGSSSAVGDFNDDGSQSSDAVPRGGVLLEGAARASQLLERERERSGTMAVGEDLLGSFVAEATGVGAMDGMMAAGPLGGGDHLAAAAGATPYRGVGTNQQQLLQHQQGSSLLEEAGRGRGGVADALSKALLAIPGITGAGSNLALLSSRLSKAAGRAIKTTTKDALIDLLLEDVRAAVEREERAKERVQAAALLEAEALGGGDDVAPTNSGLNDSLLSNASSSTATTAAAGGGEQTFPLSERGREAIARACALRRSEHRKRTFQELVSLVPPESVPSAVLRVSAACTHVMHQHYLLLQWHRTPLDPRNEEGEFEWLHRCTLDCLLEPQEEEEQQQQGEEGGGPPPLSAAAAAAAAGGGLWGGSQETAKACEATLIALRPFLLRSRTLVWQQVQQRLGRMLITCVEVHGVNLPLPKLAQCLVLSRDLKLVGLEYCGGEVGAFMASRVGSGGSAASSGEHKNASEGESGGGRDRGRPSLAGVVAGEEGSNNLVDPCQDLHAQLRLVCSHYVDSVNREALERMRGLLVNEVWVRIPLPSGGGGASDFFAAAGGGGATSCNPGTLGDFSRSPTPPQVAYGPPCSLRQPSRPWRLRMPPWNTGKASAEAWGMQGVVKRVPFRGPTVMGQAFFPCGWIEGTPLVCWFKAPLVRALTCFPLPVLLSRMTWTRRKRRRWRRRRKRKRKRRGAWMRRRGGY